MKILIVEDNFTNRYVFQKMLINYGECDIAINGKEAIDAFTMALEEDKPYDIIFLDIMMPVMDGREALKLIRQKENESGIQAKNETKIIMITALDTPKEVINAYYHGGCTNYLVKPVDKKKIESVIKELNIQ
jgi:two-component system chemotaxis response regulator CheY